MTAPDWPSRVLHLIAPAPAGGAETVVRSLVRAGTAHGLQSLVATLHQDDLPSPFVEQLRADGSAVEEIRCGRRRYFDERAAVGTLLRRWNADVLHTHVYHADLVGYLTPRPRRVALVATVHGFTGGGWKNRWYEGADRWVLRRFDGVICVSASVRDRLAASGAKPDRIHLVPNGYQIGASIARSEARSSLAIAANGPLIGWVGRLSGEKGPDLFLEALATAHRPDMVGVMIGEGAAQAALERQAHSLGLDGRRLRFAGRRPDAAALMPAFDMLVLSSRTEGTPMALLEAMSAGVPVVAFGVGGIPQVLDQNCGWLVRPGDVAGLARAIGEVLSDPAEALRRAERARALVESEFGTARWIERIRQVYQAARPR
jgi:glycosyltransferase involved in cell wall biosynthesis